MFSSLLKCKVCGSNYVMADATHYPCSGYVEDPRLHKEVVLDSWVDSDPLRDNQREPEDA
jgi:hypothetical protein